MIGKISRGLGDVGEMKRCSNEPVPNGKQVLRIEIEWWLWKPKERY